MSLQITCYLYREESCVRDMAIYVYKHKYLEGRYTTCPFNKTAVVCYVLGAYELPSHGVLVKFIKPGVDSLMWTSLQIQPK